MFKKTLVIGLGMILGMGLMADTAYSAWWNFWEENAEAGIIGTQDIKEAKTPTTTEVEALGPTRAVSSIMQGLGRVGEKHKVLFIEVLEENYDTFLPGLMVKKLTALPYFKFDKEKKKVTIDSKVLQRHSPNMLNAQGEIKGEVSLVVKHTLDYKGIGRRYPKYYIYEASHVPTITNLKEPPGYDQWHPVDMEKVRYIDNLKITKLSSDGKAEIAYGKERITLECEELWKAKKRTEVFSVEEIVNLAKFENDKKFVKNNFDWFLSDIDKTMRTWGIGISEKDLKALRERKVTFSTEVTIFNHGIVEVETYNRRVK